MMQFSAIASIQISTLAVRNRTHIILMDNTLLSVRNCHTCRFGDVSHQPRCVSEMLPNLWRIPLASDGQQVNGD